MIKVMCVDDQVLLKEALLFMLAKDEAITTIDGGGNGYDAIENCQQHRPDVILMDIRMPRLDGIEATKRIKALCPSVKVIILTTFEEEDSVFRAIEHSADGFIVKDAKPEALLLAVKSVYNDLFVMHSNVVRVVKGALVASHTKEEALASTLSSFNLTPLDIDIIHMLADGRSNKEIALALNFTEGTIKNKVSKMLAKLELKDRTQVAVFAIKHNIL